MSDEPQSVLEKPETTSPEVPTPAPVEAAQGRATVSKFTTGTSGGYKLTLDIPEMDLESAKQVLALYNRNVQFALVPLPD